MDLSLDNLCDLSLTNADLTTDSGLRAAVMVSLFTDRRAENDDADPFQGDRRGWWADTYADQAGDLIGSRLWLLARAKRTPDTLRRVTEAAESCLAWLVEDGAATSVAVDAQWSDSGACEYRVEILLSDGRRWADVFDYPLEGL